MTANWSVAARSRGTRARAALSDFPRRVATWYSPSQLLVSLVATLALLLFATAFVASHYYGKDILASLTYIANDGFCDQSANESIAGHCFGDYRIVADYVSEPNPWDRINGNYNNYPAGSMLPHAVFRVLGDLFGSSILGLISYLTAMIVAMSVPALWASKGRPLATRIVIVGLFGVGAVPAMMAFDRGNSVGFAVPALLAFLVAMRREKYRMVIIAIVIASLIKPQYIVLVLVLIAHRRWRHVAYTLGSAAAANVLAFLVWPQHFPGTIIQSAQNVLRYGENFPLHIDYPANTSLAEGLYILAKGLGSVPGVPDASLWISDHASFVGVALALAIVSALVVLGRRVPPVIGGSLLLMVASLSPTISWPYYLVFALPIAAVLLRDPVGAPPEHGWRGVLDIRTLSRLQRAAAFAMVLATAGSVSRVVLPFPVEAAFLADMGIVATTGNLVPLLWLAAAALVLLAWAPPNRRPEAPAVSSTHAP